MSKKTETQTTILSADQFTDLGKAKRSMAVVEGGIKFGNIEVPLSEKILSRAIIEGIYRLLSAETAKVDEDKRAEYCVDIVSRLTRGYWTASEEKAATRPLTEKSSGKSLKFGRQEILGAIRDLVEPGDKATLAKIKTIESYDETKFGLFVAAQSAKPESLVAKAIAELTRKADEKAKAELEAAMADLIDL